MQVKRTEHKILLNQKERLLAIRRLEPLIPRDAHSVSNQGYEVRSLYFDTLRDRCCVEKLDGLQVHEKIRIRCYGDDDRVIKLESKWKSGEIQVKKSMPISRATMEALCRQDYSVLLDLKDDMAPFFYAKLSQGMLPRVIIQYQRLSFCLDTNNTRITFDSDIRATESNLDLFQSPMQTHPVFPADMTVMEVKFNNFLLGYLKNALKPLGKPTGSYSKYVSGRAFYRNYI